MKDVSPSDCFEVRPLSLFSSRDYDYLNDLYAPLIGVKALAIFYALLHEKADETLSHEFFFKKNQISAGEFIPALTALEAVGLVSTFLKKDGVSYFVYCLYAPRTPKEYFENILFIGTLRKYLDNVQISRLQEKYATSSLPDESFQNVSESFRGYFSPDFDDKDYSSGTASSGGRAFGKVSTGFDKNAFLKALLAKDPRFSEKSFAPDELVKLARLAALYSYNEEAIADFVLEHYSFAKPYGSRVDFFALNKEAQSSLRFAYLRQPDKKSEVHDEGALARTIRLMDSLSPVQFLAKLQHGNKPASSDLELLNEVTVEMGLSSPVTNALVFYVITTKNGQLPNKYTEKIAATLVRENIETSLDAMNYFSKTSYKKATPVISEQTPAEKSEKKEAAQVLTSPNGKVSEEAFDELMGDLYTPKKAS